jgi:glycosyltransferase involved in cell wall biosynthesis
MSEKRLLILSFYFRPDLSAGSFRTTALVEKLLQQCPDLKVDVITTLPNRYSSFNSQALEEERLSHLHIRRIRLPAHRSGMLDQTRAFLHFARQVSEMVRRDQYDLVYATSSRLMTAALGAWIAGRMKVPLYLDIRDIFVDTIKDVLPRRLSWFLRPLFAWIERWTIRRAVTVNLVSQGFEPYFRSRYPEQSFTYFTNGIDDEFLHFGATKAEPSGPAHGIVRVLYAGNMGEGQGLHAIVPALAKGLEGRAEFRLIGDGGRRTQLEFALAQAGASNAALVDPMPRADLIREYLAADVLFLHLNDHEAFKKVLPSKIFEYAALSKPIWAGVSGFSARFIAEEVSNAAVFPPCNAELAFDAFAKLELKTTPRAAFIRKFNRNSVMEKMAAHILLFVHATQTGVPSAKKAEATLANAAELDL